MPFYQLKSRHKCNMKMVTTARIIVMKIKYLFLIAIFSLEAMDNQDSMRHYAGLSKKSCRNLLVVSSAATAWTLLDLSSYYMNDQCPSRPCVACAFAAGVFIAISGVIIHTYRSLPNVYTPPISLNQIQINQILNQQDRIARTLLAERKCKNMLEIDTLVTRPN